VRRDKHRSAILEVSHKVYEKCLIFYPKDVRSDFGSEMMEVFDEQVSEAYSRSGFAGLLRVWLRATREFVTVALPGRLGGRIVPMAAVTVVLALMLWFGGYIAHVMETACPGCGH
jgi:hypothetical protein